jgi:prolyl 4-hydroxylase
MLSYIVGLVAFLVFFLNPLTQLLFPSTRPAARSPRPQLNESLLAIDSPNQTALDCPPNVYSVHIFSKFPLILYLENFLSASEREHLLDIR